MTALMLMLLAAKPNPYLAQAKVFFQGGDYKQCLKRIEQAGKWDSSIEEQVDVAVYSGLCNFQLRKAKEAQADFALALKLDPKAKLPPLTSPKAAALFEAQRPKDEVATAPIPEKEKPPEPAPITPHHEEPPAPPPPPEPTPELRDEPTASRGVPIFSIVAVGVAVVAVGLGAYFGASFRSQDSASRMAEFQSDAVALRQQAGTSALLADVMFAAAGALALTALIVFLATR